MPVFNEKHTKIINLATEQDLELKQVLEMMLKNLTKEERQKCYNGESFGKLSDDKYFYYSNGKGSSYRFIDEISLDNKNHLNLKDGAIKYFLISSCFSMKNLDLFQNIDDKIILLQVTVEIEKGITSTKDYNLYLKKIDEKYELYYKTITHNHGNIEETEKLTPITEEELIEIANIANTTTDGTKPN